MGTIAHAYGSGEQAANEGIFSNLVTLARVDGKIDAEEKKLLERVARRLSLTPEQAKDIMNHPDEFPMIPPSGKEERFERLIQFMQMTFIDGHVDESERRLVGRFGIALGFSDEDVHVNTDAILEMLKAGSSNDEILSELM